MDSRPHDDFLLPELSVLDDASPASRTVHAAEEASSPAPAEAAGTDDLQDAIDDLELELADLLTPDLEAMDLDAPAAAAPGFGTAETQNEPAGALADADADASDRAGAEPEFTAQPETTAAAADATAAAEADALREAVELELALDEMAADMLATEAPAEDDRASGETVVAVQAETVVVAQVAAIAQPAGDETAAGDAMPDPDADAPTAVEPSEVGAFEIGALEVGASAVEPAGPSPIAQTGDQFVAMTAEPEVAEHAATVEAFASTPEDAAAEASASAGPEAQPIAEASPAETPVAASPAQAPADQGQVLEGTETGGTVEAAEDAHAQRDEGIVVAEAIMVPQQDTGGDAPAAAANFEEALGAQDILARGFEAAVRSAVEQSAGRFLFQMPVHTVHDCQRVAAVNLAGDEAPTTVLVLLRADGRSFRMEDARGSDNPFAGMAVSYGGLLAHLKSLPSRAAA